MRRSTLCVALALLLGAVAPTAAAGDGLPVPVDGAKTATVTAPDGEGFRYASVATDEHTSLLQIDPDGGEIKGVEGIDGRYSIPLVGLDGTPSGISGDGTRIVLIHPRGFDSSGGFEFPRDESTFVPVDVGPDGRMKAQSPITLRGDFSFDALSPDGRRLFLTEYPSSDYNDYSVREYDLERNRLLPDPVLVAHEVSPDEMRGLPMTRTTSPDGRWEYTLYNGGGRRSDEAFIHTLDTERGISHCVDLPMVEGQSAWRVDLGLSDDAGTLNVTRADTTIATLDTETFALTEPLAPELTVAPEGGGSPSGLAIGAIAVGITLLVGTALGLRRRRRDAALPADPFGPGDPVAADPAPERDRVST